MEKIHILSTDKPSILYSSRHEKLQISKSVIYPEPLIGRPDGSFQEPKNIYITNDEKPKLDDWMLYLPKAGEWPLYLRKIHKCTEDIIIDDFKKIVLTTDQELIEDGVQAIDDKFLEWFVKNPSCEKIEVIYGLYNPMGRKVSCEKVNQNHSQCVWKYKIIIPKEETKQENCCTPIGQIKRYVDCIGCDKKPKQETIDNFYCGNEVDFNEQCQKQCDKCVNATGVDYGKLNIKQETIEEAYNRIFNSKLDRVLKAGFTGGAKWQQEKYTIEEQYVEHTIDKVSKEYIKGFNEGSAWQEKRSYSEEEVKKLLIECKTRFGGPNLEDYVHDDNVNEWFEQFKKK